MDHNLTLGQKIKRYRLVNDIRQEDMAEKMEVSRATLIKYEKGHTAINVDAFNRALALKRKHLYWKMKIALIAQLVRAYGC